MDFIIEALLAAKPPAIMRARHRTGEQKKRVFRAAEPYVPSRGM
jgi:hypothetical protein